jgi:cell division septation protein DedD
MRKLFAFTTLLAASVSITACKTTDSAVSGVKSAGSAVASGVSSAASAVPSLVNVNLSNVLNNLALDLHIDKANIPINAQIPINIAANVCGVSINVLSIGAGGGKSSGCTANSISPELKQYIQEQLAANGSVGGGAQTTTGTTGTTTTTTPTTTTPTTTTPTTTAPTTTTPQPQPTQPQPATTPQS